MATFEEAIADRLEQIHSDLADLTGRVAEGERRQANKEVHGPVTHIDAAQQLARIRLGGTDDEPWLSPWVPYGVDAGEFKSVIHPSVGQNMTLSSPAGEHRQGTLKPMAFSDANPSPSNDKDTHILADFNGAQISVTKDALILKKGDKASITLKADSISVKFGDREVFLSNDKIVTVGPTHIGLDSRDDDSLKIQTVGPLAKQAFAKPE